MKIQVLGIGREFDRDDDLPVDDLQWYGTVLVRIGAVIYEVGAVLGIRDSDKGTYRACGGNMNAEAWYEDRSDWSMAPADTGTAGVPDGLAQDVVAAISERAEWLMTKAKSS
jgi:hypothetical protein